MSCLHYRDKELFIEETSIATIAKQYGTPCYVYSKYALESNWQSFNKAFSKKPHRICYAVKANSNLTILNLFARLGSGFDIVSIGELERVIAAGGDPKKVIFSGVGKSLKEMTRAIQLGIYCFDVESYAELERIESIATQLKQVVNISLRINPNVDARTHAYIATGLSENKFGIDHNEVVTLSQNVASSDVLRLIGIACHIGSQITELVPFLQAIDCLLTTYKKLTTLGIQIQHINIGGGLGIMYRQETPPHVEDYAKSILEKFSAYPVELILEPGRSIVGNTGTLITSIEYLKLNAYKNFAIVDAGMNDLLRPALYNAWQDIKPVSLRAEKAMLFDIAGPVCESADFLGKDRMLSIQTGDLLAIDSAGAYGFSMSSNYNTRLRPPEILVDKDQFFLIRRRETIEDLLTAEKDLIRESVNNAEL